MKIERFNKWILVSSSILIALHLIPSFGARAIISTPFMTIGLYGLLYWSVSKLLLFLLLKIPPFKTNTPKTRRLTYAIIGGITLLFFISDFNLRYGKQKVEYQSYSEKNGNLFYNSPYRFHNLWKLKYNYQAGKPHSSKTDKKVDFEFEYSYNNLGFRNDGKDIEAKKNGEYRILALGDSWTEGIGTPDGQTWTALLEDKYQARGDNVTVINAGKAGSDPFYEYYTLTKIYDDLQPNGILLTLNKSDVNEIVGRGGKERFQNGDKVALKQGPWWEFFYAGSFLVRRYVRKNLGYTRMLMSQEELVTGFKTAKNEIRKALVDMKVFCDERDLNLTVAFVPEYWDMVGISELNVSLEWQVLLDIDRELVTYGIPSIYLPDCYFSQITSDSWDYWWMYDYHHTPKGYALMADCFFEYYSQ